MTPKTIAEKILSTKSGSDATAGTLVVCNVDLVLGTDASAPMAFSYFEWMGGERLYDDSRVEFALDHYAPPSSSATAAYHERVRAFSERYGSSVHEVGEGISHQLLIESGRALPGQLIVGADSHTVTCGALNLFATGVGSSDLAAAMLTGQIWLRVPATIRVTLVGQRRRASAKDVGLALVGLLGSDGANYAAIEFTGTALGDWPLDDRLVLSNLAVEAGAKAAIFPFDHRLDEYLRGRTARRGEPVEPDAGASYSRELTVDCSTIEPQIALPHSPDRVAPLVEAVGTAIQMVFVGTCAGGRVRDVHEVLAELRRHGGRLAPGVQLVITPASREVQDRLTEDGTLPALAALGAIVTTPGCGACCGTSGVIPDDGMTVLSTANRNFKGRMGTASASIFLASPAACGAAAATGRITEPGGTV